MAVGALTIKLTVDARGPYTISIHGAFWPEPRSDEVFGNDNRSNVARTEDQAGMLRETGRVMLILKLQGFIFFGTANKLLDDIRQRARREVDPVRYVLMDFGMVNGLDSSAVMCFIKLHLLALSDGLVLVITNLSPGLRDPGQAHGIIAVALVDLQRQRRLGMTGIDADHRQAERPELMPVQIAPVLAVVERTRGRARRSASE